MHAKHAAIRLMEPSEDEHVLPNAEILRRVGVLRRDDEPRVGWASSPCFGASARLTSGELTRPMGFNVCFWSNEG
jgi:hypothetical protein